MYVAVGDEHRLWIQYHFPKHLTALKITMRFRRFAQRKCSIHNWLQPFCENMTQHFVQVAHRPHERSQQRKLTREQHPDVETCFRTRRRSARNERSARSERFHALFPRRLTNVFESNIDASLVGDSLDFVGDRLLVMIDRVIRAQFLGLRQFALVASRGYHLGVKQLADLNRCRSDTRTST